MMYKLRSMYAGAEKQLSFIIDQNEVNGNAFKIKNDPRVTRVGHIARKYCIDEILQLINVLKADMSLVGPRPPLPQEVAQYDEFEKQRLSIRPGMTCYWQVYPHRHEVSFDDWVAMDLKYIISRRFSVDPEDVFGYLQRQWRLIHTLDKSCIHADAMERTGSNDICQSSVA